MKEFIKFLFDVLSLQYFEKIQQSRCLIGVNNTIDIWCEKVKQSPALLGRSISLMMLALFFFGGLLIKVSIWQSLSLDLLHYIVMPMFIASMIINYHANSTETTKEFIIRKLRKLISPAIGSIACLLVYIKSDGVLPSEGDLIIKVILCLIGVILLYFIVTPVFEIIAYIVSKKINQPILNYVQRKLSAKFLWNCLSSGISAFIIYTVIVLF